MSRQRAPWWAVLVVGACLSLPACLGPNHAVGQLARWNSEFENKWAREGVFLLCFPVYILFSFGDLLIFNSIQWWWGVNPIDRPSAPETLSL